MDPLRLVGSVGERLEPWFYERRFLRPRFLRQASLEVLRRLSAAPPLPRLPAQAGPPPRPVECDVLVVGGGPAGVAAAAALAPHARVAIVTRARLGGSLPTPEATRAGLASDVDALLAGGAADVHECTLCLGLYPEEGLVAALGPSGPLTIHAARVVVATGAYDRLLAVPGADLPGVIGVRAFELLTSQGALRGGRIGVFGGPAEAGRATSAAAAAGIGLAWSVGPGSSDGAVEPGRRLAAIRGRGRVRGAVLDGGERRSADVVVLGFSQPTYELQIQNGWMPVLVGSPGTIRTRGSGIVPMLVVGEAAGPADPAAVRTDVSAAAGAWLRTGELPPEPPSSSLQPATEGRSPDAIVCLCEDVRIRDLDRCLAEGFADVELVKRRSGAGTGACQGKLCLSTIAEHLGSRGLEPAFPTNRPPIRPARLAALGGRPA